MLYIMLESNKFKFFLIAFLFISFSFPVPAFAALDSLLPFLIFYSPPFFIFSYLPKFIYITAIKFPQKEIVHFGRRLFFVSISEALLSICCVFITLFLFHDLNEISQLFFYIFFCSLFTFLPNMSIFREDLYEFLGAFSPPIKIVHSIFLTYIPLSIIFLTLIARLI